MVKSSQSQGKNDSSQLVNKLNSYTFLPADYISNVHLNDSLESFKKMNSSSFFPTVYSSDLYKILGSSNSSGGSNNSNQSQVKDNSSKLTKKISMIDLLNEKIKNILKNKNYQDLYKIVGSNTQNRSVNNTNKANNDTNPYDKIYSSLGMNKNNDKTEIPIRQLLNERPVGIPGLTKNMVYYVNVNESRNKVTITIQAGEPAKGQALNTIENWFKTNVLERKNIDFGPLDKVLVIAQSIVASRGKLIDDLGKTDGIYVSGEIDGNKIKVSYYGNLSVKKLLKGDVKALGTLFGGDKIVIEVNGDKASYIAALLVASVDPLVAGNLARYYPGTEFEKIYKAQQKGYI